MKKLFILAGIVWASISSPAMAIGDFDIKNLTADQQNVFRALSEDLSSLVSYKAITPAEPLGGGLTLIGFDVGLEVTATTPENDDVWGKDIVDDGDISVLLLPKVHAHLGFPFGIDVGAVYSTLPGSNLKYMGGEVRYSFVSGNTLIPAISLRGAFTTVNGIDELSFNTKSVELSVSKGFLMLTPYVGLGQVWTTSDPSVKVPGTNPLEKEEFNQPKLFMGVNLNLGLLNIAVEGDKTGDARSYSGKLSFRF